MNIEIKVYYEDTDATGRVYNANYLKYLERARTEYIYNLDISHSFLKDKYSIFFVVKHIEIDFKKPAFFEDLLKVSTDIISFNKYKILFHQIIKKENSIIIDSKISIVAIDQLGSLVKIPEIFQKKIGNI